MNGNILIVDDAADIRDLLGTLLRDTYQVAEADSATALKQAYSRPQPDVILLDIKLPDADGLDLLPQIKKQWPETEVGVLTGNATFELAVEATKRGAYNFLDKPFRNEGLRVMVERALEHKAHTEESGRLRLAVVAREGVFESEALKVIDKTIQ